jgi:formate hydrogenlyase subunit 3/multisubunit Na+/H+ antiporter MnhD subunit
MYKRIFFGKIPERLVNVTDSNRYITVTMAVLAGLTLILGVYPDPILNPITSYVESIFPPNSGVSQLPSSHSTGTPEEQRGVQDKSDLQSNIVGNDNSHFDTYDKLNNAVTHIEGRTYGEDNQKYPLAKLESLTTT